MDDNYHSLTPLPDGSLANTVPRANRIMSAIVGEMLALTRREQSKQDSEVQYQTGRRFLYGEGVARDGVEAVRWFKSAAENGHAGAQTDLGWCYMDGWGVEKDAEQAMRWILKAVEQGDASAQWYLGYSYSEGCGVKQDPEQAVFWYRKAAEQGASCAQDSLASCYMFGEGVEENEEQALHWYLKATVQLRRDGLEGNWSAPIKMGSYYESGEEVPRDLPRAFMWFKVASDRCWIGQRRLELLIPIMSPCEIHEGERIYREAWSSVSLPTGNTGTSETGAPIIAVAPQSAL